MVLKGKNTTIYGNVQFGKNVLIEDNVVIGHPSPAELAGWQQDQENYTSLEELYNARSKAPVIIGDNSIIRSGSVIYSGVVIGDRFDCSHAVTIRESCCIGHHVYVKTSTTIHSRCIIGNNCRLAGSIADRSTIEDNVSTFGTLTHRYARQYTPDMHNDLGPTLHQGCIVGRGAVIIGDVHIGTGAIIAANSTVNFNVPPQSLVVGTLGTAKERKAKAIAG